MKTKKDEAMIRSLQNPKLKFAKKIYDDKRFRIEQKLFALEGLREIKRALENDYQPWQVFFCEDLIKQEEQSFIEKLLRRDAKLELVSLNKPCFEKLCIRSSQGGLFLLFKRKEEKNFELFKTEKNHFWLALEAIEKPGNLGAILRTAKLAGVSSLFLLDHKIDPLSPQVIRNSLGAIFDLPPYLLSSKDFKKLCQENKVQTIAAALSPSAKNYLDLDYKKKTCLLFGSEAKGLSPFWLEEADKLAAISMEEGPDSLNLAASAAIFCFELRRQRQIR